MGVRDGQPYSTTDPGPPSSVKRPPAPPSGRPPSARPSSSSKPPSLFPWPSLDALHRSWAVKKAMEADMAGDTAELLDMADTILDYVLRGEH